MSDVAPSRVARNLAQIRDRIAAACLRVGRSPSSVRLVAVSKRIPDQLLLDACRADQWSFGENRIQDALPRRETFFDRALEAGLDPELLDWHFVGTLQGNKVSKALGCFSLLHGIDSIALAQRLDRSAGKQGVRQPYLLQVNASGEETKHGLTMAEVPGAVAALADLRHAELRGFMAMGRAQASDVELRRTFASVRELAVTAEEACGRPLPELSLGMSGDFEIAVEEGATLVRVGTAIFGPRQA